ncbi:GerAB/ArcD/ProY family transporter [Alicyclobacillus contaminans]|uniref:GerAB/ArcD/ProY family transporter n=1 Tax=Alicyclobacillus contaminans TaxID=392016 RepID=UPI00146FB65A|nr:GerAB/ArcD/ProY family transporter [Alicyclobacillus contaminans]
MAILTFEAVLGSGLFEWVPAWLDRVHTAIWVPFAAYVLVAAVLSLLIVDLIRALDPQKAPSATVFDALMRTRWLSAAINGLMLVAFLIYAGIALRTAIHLIKYIALPYTPVLVLAVLWMLIPLQLFSGGFDTVLRFEVALFWPTLIVAIIMLLLCLEVSDLANLLPVWPTDWGAVARTLPQLLYLLPGWMLFAVYLPLFRDASRHLGSMRLMVLTGFLSAAALQALNIGIVLVDFGPYEGATLNWPIVEAVRIQQEGRWPVLFLLPILVAVSSVINLYAYAAYRIVVCYTRIRSMWVAALLLAIVIILCVIPESLKYVFSGYAPVLELAEAIIYAALLGLWIRTKMKGRPRCS